MAGLITLVTPSVGAAQGLSADISAGRLVYDEGSTTVGSDNVLGTIRYEQHDAWLFGSVAAPVSGSDTFWTAVGTGGRLRLPWRSQRLSIGVDADAHAFSFRDRLVDQTGVGGALETLPFLQLAFGSAFLEGYSGWRGHTVAQAGVRSNRDVIESGLRAAAGRRVRVEAEGRWVSAPEGVFPFVGGTLTVENRALRVWARAGRWLDATLDDPVWGGGIDVRLSARSHIWTSFRQDASDPLYFNSARKTWSIGATRQLGGASASGLPIRSYPAGPVVLRVAAGDVPGDAVFIGGDFNGWQAVAMHREGNAWMVTLRLSPGTYHYAFRTAGGSWFVPASTYGRRDDGMGGSLAVLMVS
jgi:hypothetical protein